MTLVPLACLLVTLVAAPPLQQATSAAPNESATQFYLRWRITAINAKSIDEITAFWTADTVEQFNMEDDSAKAATLAMIRRAYSPQTDVRVVKEIATPQGATLSLEGLDHGRHSIVSTVQVLKENGAWKMSPAVEQWQPKGSRIPD
jgi:hypothetical protein